MVISLFYLRELKNTYQLVQYNHSPIALSRTIWV
jgi:hypothetical protein